MRGDFEQRIKNIESELLDLKTATEYSSTRNASIFYSQTVRTGLYLVRYANDTNLPILSRFYVAQESEAGVIYPRTPDASSQIIEVDSLTYDSASGQYITLDIHIMAVTNVPVTSITRIS